MTYRCGRARIPQAWQRIFAGEDGFDLNAREPGHETDAFYAHQRGMGHRLPKLLGKQQLGKIYLRVGVSEVLAERGLDRQRWFSLDPAQFVKVTRAVP